MLPIKGREGRKSPASAQLAARLRNILSSKGKLMSKAITASWEKDLRELLEERSVEQVERALDWFDRNIAWQYTPKIRSAKSLYERFTDLEDAMSRQQQEQARQRNSNKAPMEENW